MTLQDKAEIFPSGDAGVWNKGSQHISGAAGKCVKLKSTRLIQDQTVTLSSC